MQKRLLRRHNGQDVRVVPIKRKTILKSWAISSSYLLLQTYVETGTSLVTAD